MVLTFKDLGKLVLKIPLFYIKLLSKLENQKYLLPMITDFDCTQFLASFEVFQNKINKQDQKILNASSLKTSINSESSVLELTQIQNIFSLQVEEPKEVNHVWFDQQQYTLLDKVSQFNRKDTLDDDHICNQGLDMLMQVKQQKKRIKSQKNQTKNIPKNFGKAILAFIQKNKKLTKKALQKSKEGTYNQLIEFLAKYKTDITTIAQLRTLWVENQYQKTIRILSCLFLRKYSFDYIFNSRVCNYGSHIKYRQRFMQALIKPQQFQHIKQY